MKHLKKFNEELHPYKYRKVASELRKIGHPKRASSLEDWASKRQEEEERKRMENNIIQWKSNCETYSKYGKVKWIVGDPVVTNVQSPAAKGVKGIVTLRKITGIDKSIVDDFYIKISVDTEQFHESICDIEWFKKNKPESTNADVYLNLSLAIVPTSEETLNRMIKDERFKNSIWNGAFFVGWVTFKMKVPLKSFQGERLEVSNVELMIDDGSEFYSMINDRRSAGIFKRILLGIFNENDYPAIYTKNHTTLYDQIESVVCNKSGLSSDYGLEMGHFTEAIKKLNPNSLFKEY